ncbi:MAG TPA: sigma-70 family RNA polymerase sigma factor [Stellaceae bacterium]|nr:sigma-70 family RNA polymerase sigma factor [Stellaceae bacterium]
MADAIDLGALCLGEKSAWDGFVRRYAGLIVSAVRGVARDQAEAEDLVQDVFLRLCKDGFRLMRTYDPARAGLSTWLTIVARSTARDALRRRQLPSTPIDAVPEQMLAVMPKSTERLKYPDALLSPRQKLVLSMIYDKDMDVAEIAKSLAVDPQTVRSTHHKAMLKLRSHFAQEDAQPGGDERPAARLSNKVMETKDVRRE